jgi:hypothetical protein
MKRSQANRVFIVAAFSFALVGCAVGAPGSGATSASPSSSTSAGASEVPVPTSTKVENVVARVQPQPLIDLDCSDFAGVASVGTIAGVTERDPRGVIAEISDVVPLADMVRNAGGVACEFSDGGLWKAPTADGGVEINTAWRGAAMFVVPNVGAAADDLALEAACGEPVNGLQSVCVVNFMVGASLVTLAVSTNDRRETRLAVTQQVTDIVASAPSKAGPIERSLGTFQPPRDCATLVPTAQIASLLGGSDVMVDRPIQNLIAAEATFLTENIGCQWYRDSGPTVADVHVYPGGGWAADLTLPGLGATPIEIVGLGDGDTAVSHCADFSEYGYCHVELVVDGTWVRAIGGGPDQATSTAIAVAVAEATVAQRD